MNSVSKTQNNTVSYDIELNSLMFLTNNNVIHWALKQIKLYTVNRKVWQIKNQSLLCKEISYNKANNSNKK